MEKYIINSADLTDRETTHTILKETLHLPDYYGNNLDALWDVLSTDTSSQMIIIKNPDLIRQQLGRYGVKLLKLFIRLKRVNKQITLVLSYDLKKSFP